MANATPTPMPAFAPPLSPFDSFDGAFEDVELPPDDAVVTAKFQLLKGTPQAVVWEAAVKFEVHQLTALAVFVEVTYVTTWPEEMRETHCW